MQYCCLDSKMKGGKLDAGCVSNKEELDLGMSDVKYGRVRVWPMEWQRQSTDGSLLRSCQERQAQQVRFGVDWLMMSYHPISVLGRRQRQASTKPAPSQKVPGTAPLTVAAGADTDVAAANPPASFSELNDDKLSSESCLEGLQRKPKAIGRLFALHPYHCDRSPSECSLLATLVADWATSRRMTVSSTKAKLQTRNLSIQPSELDACRGSVCRCLLGVYQAIEAPERPRLPTAWRVQVHSLFITKPGTFRLCRMDS